VRWRWGAGALQGPAVKCVSPSPPARHDDGVGHEALQPLERGPEREEVQVRPRGARRTRGPRGGAPRRVVFLRAPARGLVTRRTESTAGRAAEAARVLRASGRVRVHEVAVVQHERLRAPAAAAGRPPLPAAAAAAAAPHLRGGQRVVGYTMAATLWRAKKSAKRRLRPSRLRGLEGPWCLTRRRWGAGYAPVHEGLPVTAGRVAARVRAARQAARARARGP